MTSAVQAEREAFAATLLAAGPDAPTLAGAWTTRDLAAHVVIRDRRPDAAPGIVSPFLATYSEHVREGEAARPYQEIVARVRKGPPRWSPLHLEALDRLANSVEMFVHHEDVRRAGQRPAEPRPLDPELEEALVAAIERSGRLLTRHLSVGLVVEPDGRPTITVRPGADRVTVAGPLAECVLFLNGRKDVARVTLRGPAAAISTVRETPLGL